MTNEEAYEEYKKTMDRVGVCPKCRESLGFSRRTILVQDEAGNWVDSPWQAKLTDDMTPVPTRFAQLMAWEALEQCAKAIEAQTSLSIEDKTRIAKIFRDWGGGPTGLVVAIHQ